MGYLGSPFSLSLLRKIIKDNEGVENAVSSGMIIHYNGDLCCFAHDQLQLAAKSLLPRDPKPIYLYVARKLCNSVSKDEFRNNICLIAHLYHSAKDLINDDERFKVAELFKMAGEKE